MFYQEIILLIKVMNGGGAERVLSLLANHFLADGYKVTLVITHQRLEHTDLNRLNDDVQVIALEDMLATTDYASPFHLLLARLIGKIDILRTVTQDTMFIRKYAARNHTKVKWLKCFFHQHKNAILIAFMYDAIFLSLLARTPTNRLIISERGDPRQSLGSKTDLAFFKTMFPKADAMVFQSPDAQKWYKENVGIEGTVIFNPVTNGLPLPYNGIRNKRVVNFCRISPPKNLNLLIEAFEHLHANYPDYELWIFGDTDSNAPEYAEKVFARINSSECREAIHLHPAIKNIHSKILEYTMFVSSSDHEGMSNSMLEAMAIGLPVICTDCPSGGARAVIQDHENGLLVSIKDSQALYLAMKEVIEHPDLAKKLSVNAIRVRQTQSEEAIMQQWQSLVEPQTLKER